MTFRGRVEIGFTRGLAATGDSRLLSLAVQEVAGSYDPPEMRTASCILDLAREAVAIPTPLNIATNSSRMEDN